MKSLKLAILAAALTAASSASASLTVVIETPSPAEVVQLVVSPTGSSGVPAFNSYTSGEGVYAGIYNQTVNGVQTSGFCIDVAHDVSVNESFNNYSYATLSSAPATPAGPMKSDQIVTIEQLWAAYYQSAKTDVTGLTAAALQVAIWKTLGDGEEGYTVSDSSLGYTPNGTTMAVFNEAATMLASLSPTSPEANLTAIVSIGTGPTSIVGQGYVISAVPEPTTLIAGVLLLLPFGASTLRIVRKNRAA